MNEIFELVHGLIDPVTAGFLISTGSKVIGSMMGPGEEDTKAAMDAATRVSHAQKQQAGQELDLAQKQNKMKTENLMKGATKAGQKSLTELVKGSQQEISFSGFESTASTEVDTSKTYSEYGDTVDQIMGESELAKEQTDLATTKRIQGIESELDSTITSILKTPDTFLEKFTGATNMKAG
jgi:hypothetical protein